VERGVTRPEHKLGRLLVRLRAVKLDRLIDTLCIVVRICVENGNVVTWSLYLQCLRLETAEEIKIPKFYILFLFWVAARELLH
jgi:hypothetical protein